jgi:hypothetical protein
MLTIGLLAPGPRGATVIRTLVTLGLLLVLLLLAGCADVERTVTARDVGETGARTVAWESNLYPSQNVRASVDCWERAIVSEAVPDDCLTGRVLAFETEGHTRSPWIAWGGSVLVIASLLWFAMKRIAWRPTIASRTVSTPAPRHLAAAAAVRLMRSVDEERADQLASGERAHDVRHPATVGVSAAVLLLVSLILLFGYGSALGWANVTGFLVLIGLAIGGTFILMPLGPRPLDPDASVSRMVFLGSFGAVFFLTPLVGLGFRPPVLELNGVAWPF